MGSIDETVNPRKYYLRCLYEELTIKIKSNDGLFQIIDAVLSKLDFENEIGNYEDMIDYDELSITESDTPLTRDFISLIKSDIREQLFFDIMANHILEKNQSQSSVSAKDYSNKLLDYFIDMKQKRIASIMDEYDYFFTSCKTNTSHLPTWNRFSLHRGSFFSQYPIDSLDQEAEYQNPDFITLYYLTLLNFENRNWFQALFSFKILNITTENIDTLITDIASVQTFISKLPKYRNILNYLFEKDIPLSFIETLAHELHNRSEKETYEILNVDYNMYLLFLLLLVPSITVRDKMVPIFIKYCPEDNTSRIIFQKVIMKYLKMYKDAYSLAHQLVCSHFSGDNLSFSNELSQFNDLHKEQKQTSINRISHQLETQIYNSISTGINWLHSLRKDYRYCLKHPELIDTLINSTVDYILAYMNKFTCDFPHGTLHEISSRIIRINRTLIHESIVSKLLVKNKDIESEIIYRPLLAHILMEE